MELYPDFVLVQGQILVNEAAVTEAAVEAKNGRLYVMDGVLIPPSIEPVLPHRCDLSKTKIIMVSSVSVDHHYCLIQRQILSGHMTSSVSG